jgi:hypothetical protein
VREGLAGCIHSLNREIMSERREEKAETDEEQNTKHYSFSNSLPRILSLLLLLVVVVAVVVVTASVV